MEQDLERFWISQAGILIRENKCLILELAGKPGFWDIPGGRLNRGELAESGFQREIKEELGIDNFLVGKIVDYDIWYTPKGDPVCAIAILIKNEKDEIILSDEHLQYKWVAENELDDYKFIWLNAKRMLVNGFRE